MCFVGEGARSTSTSAAFAAPAIDAGGVVDVLQRHSGDCARFSIERASMSTNCSPIAGTSISDEAYKVFDKQIDARACS